MTDRAFNEFLNAFDEKTLQQSKRGSRAEVIAKKKREALEPIAMLLTRLSKLGLIVEDARSAAGAPGFPQGKEAEFLVTEGPSAPSWAPGVSLFIDHPAEIEIAIPNEHDIPEEGPVVITCATEHPDRGMLIKKHASAHAAADALARFLAKNTLRITNDPRKMSASEDEEEAQPAPAAQASVAPSAPKAAPGPTLAPSAPRPSHPDAGTRAAAPASAQSEAPAADAEGLEAE